MENINKENFAKILGTWISKEKLELKKVAKVIGCSTSTLNRLVQNKTYPTDESLKQTAVLIELGYKSYSKLSSSQKEKISETIGAVGGGGIAFASITAIISTLGYAGLGAAGIVSGLATLGGIIGGGMLSGILIAAALPVAGIVAGFGLIKGIKYLTSEYKVSVDEIDKKWEIIIN